MMSNAEAPPNLTRNDHEWHNKRERELDWWWFNPIQCWNEIHELWNEGGVKSLLSHHSRRTTLLVAEEGNNHRHQKGVL